MKSLNAMRKAGRVMATSVTIEQKRIAERFLNLAVELCEKEKPGFFEAYAAYNDGLKGAPIQMRGE